MIWTHTDRLAVYYDGVTIISIMWDMFYGIPGGVLGRNTCSRLLKFTGGNPPNTSIFNIMTIYANMSQRSSLLMTAALATEDESRALARIADISTSNSFL